MNKIHRLLHLYILIAVLTPTGVFAGGQLYLLSPNAPFWPDSLMPAPYNINPDSAAGYIDSPDPAQDFVNAVVNAFDTWESISTARLTFARGPDCLDPGGWR